MSGFSGYVFGIGLSRTGTRSLAASLDHLGFPCVHYPDPALMLAGDHTRALRGHRAACDITVTAFYPKLDAAYPGSRFVLTVRPVADWLPSIRAHTERIIRDTPHELEPDNAKGRIRTMCFGTMGWDEDRFITAEAEHRASVSRYFADRPTDLLVIDVTSGDPWQSLCPFLGVDVPAIRFPHMNMTIGRGGPAGSADPRRPTGAETE